VHRTALCLLVFLAPAFAGADTVSPARFREGNGSLAAHIQFPDQATEVDVILDCESPVSARGEIGRVFCHPQAGTHSGYLRAVGNAVSKVRLYPARVNGLPKSIWLQYSVHFFRSADSAGQIGVYLHHDGPILAKGRSITWPQPYFFPRSGWGRACFLSGNFMARIRVDEAGNPVSHTLPDRLSAPCARAMKGFIERSRYVPATIDGVPAEATFDEVFFHIHRIR
jgi:hypothetical protein